VEPTNLVAMGVPVSASTRTVDFRFDRTGFGAGAAVSVSALVLMALMARSGRRLRRS
jgi:hypothetical protein